MRCRRLMVTSCLEAMRSIHQAQLLPHVDALNTSSGRVLALDISRAIFIGKKQENDRRYELLELIDELRQTAWKTIRPGITMGDLNKEMRRICGVWLCAHNVLHEGYTDEDVKKYYWHNTGHHLGLDVHDVSLKDKPFEKGNCLAIEPGVYIEEWGTGFRIEDDVLVTDNGCELLSSGKNVGEVLL